MKEDWFDKTVDTLGGVDSEYDRDEFRQMAATEKKQWEASDIIAAKAERIQKLRQDQLDRLAIGSLMGSTVTATGIEPKVKPRSPAAEAAAKDFEEVAAGARPPFVASPVKGGYTGGKYRYPTVTTGTWPKSVPRPGSARPDPEPGNFGPGFRNPNPTAEQALEAIMREVRGASDEDVLRVAGEWITKVTNGISKIVRSRDHDDTE